MAGREKVFAERTGEWGTAAKIKILTKQAGFQSSDARHAGLQTSYLNCFLQEGFKISVLFYANCHSLLNCEDS